MADVYMAVYFNDTDIYSQWMNLSVKYEFLILLFKETQHCA